MKGKYGGIGEGLSWKKKLPFSTTTQKKDLLGLGYDVLSLGGTSCFKEVDPKGICKGTPQKTYSISKRTVLTGAEK